ncbi:MAG: hypothetical protein RL155_463 [Actinomycetota bacterium]
MRAAKKLRRSGSVGALVLNLPKNSQPQKDRPKKPYAKRVDEVSAGGLVVDSTGTKGLLIGRIDAKDVKRERLLWSLPKGHIETGETPEQAAIREVKEETGIESQIDKSTSYLKRPAERLRPR